MFFTGYFFLSLFRFRNITLQFMQIPMLTINSALSVILFVPSFGNIIMYVCREAMLEKNFEL